jgi:flagellar biosynthesis protein FlhG
MSQTTSRARIIAVTSGKGGVGKSCLTANLAWVLVHAGHRVLVIDADLGLANLDILLNLTPSATLHDVLVGTRELQDVILVGPGGIHIVPAGSGMAEYSRVTSELQEQLPDLLRRLSRDYDYVFLDTGAGISDVVLYTTSLAEEILVVVTPDPTSMADAYAAIKVMAMQQGRSRFTVVMNQTTKERPGPVFAGQLQQVTDRFLQSQLGRPIGLTYLGALPTDPAMERSICLRRLLMVSAPESPAARALFDLGKRLEVSPRPPERPGVSASCSVATHE